MDKEQRETGTFPSGERSFPANASRRFAWIDSPSWAERILGWWHQVAGANLTEVHVKLHGEQEARDG